MRIEKTIMNLMQEQAGQSARVAAKKSNPDFGAMPEKESGKRMRPMVNALGSNGHRSPVRVDGLSVVKQERPKMDVQRSDRESERHRSASVSFEKVYKAVAHTNVAARKSIEELEPDNAIDQESQNIQALKCLLNDSTPQATEDGLSAPVDDQDANDSFGAQLSDDLRKLLEGGANVTTSEELAALLQQAAGGADQATTLIRDALSELSSLLNLNLVADPATLGPIVPSTEAAVQFAQMLEALKGIAQVLDTAIANGETVQIRGTGVHGESALAMVKCIARDIFKLEIGLKALGMAPAVAQQSALISGIMADATLPQATNPQQLAMPQYQAQQILDNAVTGTQPSMDKLLKQVAAVIESQNAGSTGELQRKLAGIVELSGTVKPLQQVAGELPGSVLRTVLKIDANVSGIAVENKQAAAAVEADALPTVSAPVLAKSVDETAIKIEQGSLAILDASSKNGSSGNLSTVKEIPLSQRQTVEESVVKQVVERMQAAIKTGLHEVRITLRPEALGEVRVQLRIEGDIVFARISVENQQVQKIVESNMQHLKDSLAQQNLQTGSMDVSVDRGDHEELSRQWEENQAARAGRDAHGLNGSGESAENNREFIPMGTDTGRRFGVNSVEYFM